MYPSSRLDLKVLLGVIGVPSFSRSCKVRMLLLSSEAAGG